MRNRIGMFAGLLVLSAATIGCYEQPAPAYPQQPPPQPMAPQPMAPQPVPNAPEVMGPPPTYVPPQPMGVVKDVYGRPPFHAGSPLGYWIWVDPSGTWHLRSTTGSIAHVFTGRVIATRGGVISSLRPKFMRPGFDGMSAAPRLVNFTFRSPDPIHGFTFRSTSGCVRFELFIDGRAIPRVHLGASGVRAEGSFFERCQ